MSSKGRVIYKLVGFTPAMQDIIQEILLSDTISYISEKMQMHIEESGTNVDIIRVTLKDDTREEWDKIIKKHEENKEG